MANEKYITLSEEALTRLCGLVRESHSVSEGINDDIAATNSTYSSVKIEELLANLGEDVSVKELTLVEYEALSEEEQNNGTIYFITDGIIGIETKNTYSKVEVDELVSTFWDGDPIAFDETTIASNTSTTITKDITKEGYVPVLPTLRNIGNADCISSGLVINGTELRLAIKNLSNSEVTITPSAYVLYRKND